MSELPPITNNAQWSSLELRAFTSAARVIAGDPNRTFSPTTSTLIFGARDAVLADALLIREDVDALGDMIVSTGRTLTTIFITHGHGDHFLGSDRLIARFPGARAVTTPGIVDYHQFAYRGWCAAVFVLLWRHRLEGDLAAVAARS
jgi:glyoxylase-like metal-dependent hydrolase (beta-lactamase superfamily II)